MRISSLSFYSDPNVGLYSKTSDKFCLAGNSIQERSVQKIEERLNVNVEKCVVANTDFVGLFVAMNSNGILLPKLVSENEMAVFEKISKKFKVNLDVMNSRFSALGNLILCNDSGAIASKLFKESDVRKIEDCLGVEVVKAKIAGVDIVGSCGVATNRGCLLHRDSTEKEIELVESVLKVSADIGTANFGSPFVGSCMIVNSNGAIVGNKTTAPELQRTMDALQLG